MFSFMSGVKCACVCSVLLDACVDVCGLVEMHFCLAVREEKVCEERGILCAVW